MIVENNKIDVSFVHISAILPDRNIKRQVIKILRLLENT